jgi:hypothetical protein
MNASDPLVSTTEEDAPQKTLHAYLQRHRKQVALGYMALVTLFAAVVLFPAQLLPGGGNGGWDDWWSPLLVLGAFFGLQASFLLGSGRIRVGVRVRSRRRLVIAVIVSAAMMALLTAAFFMSFLEYGDRLRGAGSVRLDGLGSGPGLGADAPYGAGRWLAQMWLVVLVSWFTWTVALMQYVRRRTHDGGLVALIEIVLAGSWLDLVISAPVHLVLRRTRAHCECQVGTWLAIWISLPVVLWSLGPAVLMLFVREWRISEARRRRRWLSFFVHRPRRRRS